MRLVTVWSAESRKDRPTLKADDLTLCFDPLASELAHSSDGKAIDADSMLGWQTRARIDEQAAALARRLTDDRVLANVRAAGQPVIEFAYYDLVVEFSNLLRGFELGSALAGAHRIDELVAQPSTPSAVRLGVWAGVASENGAACGVPPVDPWTPISFSGAHNRTHELIARGALAAAGSAWARRRIHVLAVPAGKVGAALERLDRSELVRARVGIGNFPGLSQGHAARLVLRRGLPGVATGSARGRHERPAGSPASWPIPSLDRSPPLDQALHALVERALAQSYEPTLRAAGALRVWESLGELRALLLPYTAVGPARLAARWAHERGVEVAVVQHGVYGLRLGLGADTLADVVLGWGPGVAEQVAAWPEGNPTVWPVGVPDFPSSVRGERPVSIERVLVATTNRPLGSAIGAYGFVEAFIEDIAPGLRQWLQAGVRVELRLHPAESRTRYQALLAKLGLELPFSGKGPFAELAASADLVISSVSSAAFEAAAIGRPVLLWLGRAPPEIRQRCLLPPFSEALPGQFVDGQAFRELVERGLREPSALIGVAKALADRLADYARPLDHERFASALLRLGYPDATAPSS